MATPPRKAPPPVHWKMVFGAATGSARDFYVLGYCHELDEQEIAINPEHEEFTWILHFLNDARTVVAKVPQRLNDIWLSPSGVAYAVGTPRGVLEIQGMACTETRLANASGTSAAIWGVSDEHIFACGHHDSFLLYRRAGKWSKIDLPQGTAGLWDVNGFNERDVYAVSDEGQILHFDGRQILILESPTTRWLTSLAPMPDGRMCIGGYDGILLHGNRQGWRFVATGTDAPLLHLAPYRGGVCFVTSAGLWWFDGKSAPQLLIDQGGRWVNSLGDTIMIVNEEDAWLFDGANLLPLDTQL